VLVFDTKEDERWLQRDWDERGRSAIALPLSVGGMVIGALTLVRPETDQFTEDDLNALENAMKNLP
jgi:putative methionine-R-sulfoxide reductase with GAF domain